MLFVFLSSLSAQEVSLSGLVWQDADRDGIRAVGESPLPGLSIRLFATTNGLVGDGDDVLLASVSSQVDGTYHFDSLTPGTYFIEFDLPSNWELSPAGAGENSALDSDFSGLPARTPAMDLAAGNHVNRVDAGVRWNGKEGFEAGAPGWSASNGVWEVRTVLDGAVRSLRPGFNPEVILQASKSHFTVDEPVVLSWENGPGEEGDWIVVYEDLSNPHTSFSDWLYANGSEVRGTYPANGSVSFNELEPGSYAAFYLAINEDSQLEDLRYPARAVPVGFYVGDAASAPSLSLNQTHFEHGTSIGAIWTNAPGDINDWVGIYSTDTIPRLTTVADWVYLNGTRTPTAGDYTSGSVSLDSTALAPGEYAAFLFANNAYDLLAGPIVFTVGDSSPNPAPFEGEGMAVTKLGGDYPNDRDSRLITPDFVIPAAGPGERVEFRFQQSFDYGATDGAAIQLSVWTNEGWSEWEKLRAVATTASVRLTHAIGDWETVQLDLTHLAGQRLRLGFHHAAESGTGSETTESAAGWHLDELELWLGEPVSGFEGWDGWEVVGGVWQMGIMEASLPTNPSGIETAVAGTVLSWNYPPDAESRLISPPLQLPKLLPGESLVYHFRHYFAYAGGDGGRIEISRGAGWTTLATVSPNSSSGGWIKEEIDLSLYDGDSVRLSFFHYAGEGEAPVDDPDHLSAAPGWFLEPPELTFARLPSLILPESFEDGFAQWRTEGTWQATTTPQGTGPEDAFDGDTFASMVAWGDPGYSHLVSNPFTVPEVSDGEALELRFYQWQDRWLVPRSFHRMRASTFDGLFWSDWINLEHVGGEGWEESWNLVRYDLTPFAGQEIMISFLGNHFLYDVNFERAIDNVHLWSGEYRSSVGRFSPYGIPQSVLPGDSYTSYRWSDWGDFNSDGLLDFVASGSIPGTVVVGLAQPGGRFVQTVYDEDVSGQVQIVDVDADGIEDLVFGGGQFTRREAALMRGLGGGLFSTPLITPIDPEGPSMTGLAVGDLNSDGWVDLVSANGSTELILRMGNGAWSFAEGVSLGFDMGPVENIEFADLNQDGRLDLIVLDAEDGWWVAWGNGTGTFSDPVHTVLGGVVHDLDFGYLDTDATLDVIACVEDTVALEDELVLSYGDGTGGFSSSTRFEVLEDLDLTCTSVAMTDLNQDFRTDLVVILESRWSLSEPGVQFLTAFLALPDGTYEGTRLYEFSEGATAFGIGDVSGDGIRDLGVVDANTGRVNLWESPGDGRFKASAFLSVGSHNNLAVADLNNDGLDDIVRGAQSGWDPDFLEIRYGDAEGIFAAEATITDHGFLGALADDFDGDGDFDLMLGLDGVGSRRVQLEDGWSALQNNHLVWPPGESHQVDIIGAIRPEGDLLPDLVVAHENEFMILRNLGDWNFDTATPEVIDSIGEAYKYEYRDRTSDGRPDLVAYETIPSGDTSVGTIARLYENSGEGHFLTVQTVTVRHWIAFTADLDRNGTLDVFEINQLDGGRAVLFAPDGSVTLGDEIQLGEVSVSASRDFDGDGNLDLFGYLGRANSIAIFFGLGDGNFQPPVFHYMPFTGGGFETFGEMTGDGLPELFDGNSIFTSWGPIYDEIHDWRILNFGSEAEDPGREEELWGESADPDGDRIINSVERALGFNPMDPNPGLGIWLRKSVEGMVLSHPVSENTAVVPMVWSLDLRRWSIDPPFPMRPVESGESDRGRRQVEILGPITDPVFFRFQ